MKKQVSISDLARMLSVSVSTVSRALHDHPSISDGMKELVRQKAKEHNYRPNSYAVNLKMGSTKTIAVIVPQINRNFFSTAINGIEEVARENGYDVMIYQSHNDHDHEARIVNNLSFGKVDGVIASVANTDLGHQHYNKMIDYGMPTVFFDRILKGLNAGSVRIDDFKGSYMATEHFIKQGMKRIYHFAGKRNVVVWDDRAKGYIAAMKDNGLEIDEKSWIFEDYTTRSNGSKFISQILESGNELPEAINFAGDFAALGALQQMNEKGIKVPHGIAISGFACEPFCGVLSTPLTSVDQFSNKMGREAAKMLIDYIEGKPYENIVIEPELIVRESSLKLKKNE